MIPILFNTRDELIKIDLDKLVYAEADGNYVTLTFLNGQRIVVSLTLQRLEQLIAQSITAENKERFLRIGRRYIVGRQYITQINLLKQTLTLSELQYLQPIVLSVHKEALKALKQTIIEKYEVKRT